MNITDIDNKIIKRAGQNQLYTEYAKQQRTVEVLILNLSKNDQIQITLK